MSNTFNPSSLVSKQMVQSLHARGMLINTVNKAYSKDFTQKKYVPGQTVTIDIEHQPTITSGRVANVQDVTNRTTSVTLGQYNGAFELTSIEKGYDIDGWRKYADGIAMRLLREMETTGFTQAQKTCGNSVGNPGVEPGSLRTWAEGQAKIVDALGPDRKYYAAASPSAMVSLTDSLKNATNPTNTISNQYATAKMKSAMNMDFYQSTSTNRHTAGTGDNTTPIMNGASQTGSTISLTGLTTTDTVTVGTKFTIADVYAVDPETKQALPYLKQHTVTATTTASSGNIAALPISPEIFGTSSTFQNVSVGNANSAAIVFLTEDEESAQGNLIYDKDALTLVSVPLPAAVGPSVHTFANYQGIQLRTGIGAWSATDDTQVLRIDAVWAWGTLRPDHMCIVQGA